MNVKDLILAFICLNLAVAIVNCFAIFPIDPRYYNPSELTALSVPDNWESVVVPSTVSTGGLLAVVLGYGLAGTALIMIGVLSMFWQPAQWALSGFSQILEWFGAPTIICQIANVFSGFLWLIFVVEYLGKRVE